MKAPTTTPISGTFRRGLVLQGGGAKGAFQFGVLKELHQNGVKFDVIAGTSVGALNGAIVAAGAWELGEELWSHLTIGLAFQLSGWAAIFTAISSLGVLFLGWLSTAYDSYLPVWLRRIFQLIASLPAIGLFLAFNLIPEGRSLRIVVAACTLALSASVPFVVGKRNSIRPQLIVVPAMLWGLFAVLTSFTHDYRISFLSFAATHGISAVVLLLPTLVPLMLLIGFIHRWINAAAFSNGPLRKTVEAIVRTGIRLPLLATAAETVPEYLDPDDFEYARIKDVYVGATRSGFKPVYERVDKLDSAKATEALLTSAALPLGIVPNSRGGAKRIRFVDGGVADNTPWFPLIDLLPCEEIVIVLCEPQSAAKDEAKLTRDIWCKRDRAIRVLTKRHDVPNRHLWDRTPPITKRDPPVVVPLRNPQFWTESKTINPVVISPPKSLGNLLSGTLNFSRKRAQENMELGCEAARVALKKGFK